MKSFTRVFGVMTMFISAACADPGEGWPVFFAQVEGTVLKRDSTPYSGAMVIQCVPSGIGLPFNTESPGNYRRFISLAYPDVLDEELCEVRGGNAAMAETDTVFFSPTRREMRITRIDIIEK